MMVSTYLPASDFTEVSVSTALFSVRAIEIACHSLHETVHATLVTQQDHQTTVRLSALDPELDIETAVRLFRRELLIAAVNLRARLDDPDIQSLAASTSKAIGTAAVQHFDDLVNQASPNLPPEGEPVSLSQSELAKTGYQLEWNREAEQAQISFHGLRFPLPVLLAAARHFKAQARLVINSFPGKPSHVVTVQPRTPGGLEGCVSELLQWLDQWALPSIAGIEMGTATLDQPVDTQLVDTCSRADHPARPGSGLPLTYFRTVYGLYEGVSLPYRLAEIFTMPITPDTFLVSTRARTWAILTRAEYRQLVEMRAHENEDLFLVLESLGIILTQRNLTDALKQFATRYQYLLRPPALFLMIPTNRCNLGCVYCHAEAGQATDYSKDMTEATARKAVDFLLTSPNPLLKPGGEFAIEFQGGECLLRWDLIKQVMDYADQRAAERQLRTRYTLCTNLTTMTDEIAQEIVRRGNIRVGSSLDGPREVNDQQRVFQGGGGTYTKATGWAEKLRAEYGVRSGLLPTLTKNNLGHEHTLVDEYRRRKCSSIYLRYVNQVGRAYRESYDTLGLNSEEYLGLWQTALDYIFEYRLRGEPILERESASLMGNMLTTNWSYMCLRRPCGMGLHQIVIDQDGAVFGCDQARSNPMFSLGNVATHTYDECYSSDVSRLARTLISELYPRCRGCAFGAYCGYCVARGTRQHGTPQPKMPEDFECSVYRRMIPVLFRKLMDPQQAWVLNSWV